MAKIQNTIHYIFVFLLMLAIIELHRDFTVFHISGFGCDKFLMGVTSNVIAIKSQAKLNREGSESIWFLSGSNPIRKSGGNDWKSVCSCMFSTTRPHNRFFIESTKANEDIPFGKCFFVKN